MTIVTAILLLLAGRVFTVDNEGPQLWFEDSVTGRLQMLLRLGGSVAVAWSPDRSAFCVEDRWASDATRVFVYEASTLERWDAGEAILKADPAARRFFQGHAYVELEKCGSASRVAVRFHGHTDEAPIVNFDLHYQLTRP